MDWSGWQAIDAVETAAGEPQGRPRVKLVSYDALNAAARARARQPDGTPAGAPAPGTERNPAAGRFRMLCAVSLACPPESLR